MGPRPTSELNLADYFRPHGMDFDPVPIDTDAEAIQQLLGGSCDVFSTDSSKLNSIHSTFEKPADYVILPEIISKEPLGPAVLEGDQQWDDIVRWTLNALIAAEELGVTSKNALDMSVNANNPEVRRLLGTKGNLGAMNDLSPDWALKAIQAVGNYGELFANTIGANSPIKMKRGLNALRVDGGLQYSPPFRCALREGRGAGDLRPCVSPPRPRNRTEDALIRLEAVAHDVHHRAIA